MAVGVGKTSGRPRKEDVIGREHQIEFHYDHWLLNRERESDSVLIYPVDIGTTK